MEIGVKYKLHNIVKKNLKNSDYTNRLFKKMMESNQDTKKNFHYALSDCGKSRAIQNVQV